MPKWSNPSTEESIESPPLPALSTTLPVRRKRQEPSGAAPLPTPPRLRRAPATGHVQVDRARRGTSRQPGLALACLSFLLGLFWLAAIKPLNTPDAPAHLEAIMQVRQDHILPEVHFAVVDGNWRLIGPHENPAVQAYATGLGRTDPYTLLPYESSQPPLFYVVAALAGLPFPAVPQTLLYVGCIVAAAFGAATVYFCWAAVREVVPGAPHWAIAVAGVIMLLPQFCFNSASVGNDSAAAFAAALAYYVWFRGLRDPRYDRWMLRAGAALGLAVLAKLTAATLVPGLALVLLFRAGPALRAAGTWAARARQVAALGTGTVAGTLAVCGWWLVRNIILYGEPTGTRNAFLFYTGGAAFVKLNPALPASRAEFLRSLWESIWGRFGWMDMSLPAELYALAGTATSGLLALTALAALVGIGLGVARRRPVATVAWQAGSVMAVVAVALIISFVQFNQTVAFQAQGRYLFLLLLPAGMLLTGGLQALPHRALKVGGLSLLLLGMGFLNLIGLALVAVVR